MVQFSLLQLKRVIQGLRIKTFSLDRLAAYMCPVALCQFAHAVVGSQKSLAVCRQLGLVFLTQWQDGLGSHVVFPLQTQTGRERQIERLM